MKLQILFDKDTKDKKLHTGWGVSFLVDERILFDTGENGPWLMENIRNLKVDINKIKAAVISHDHWDHTGGLWELLKKKEGLTVYACPNFSLEFKEKVNRLKGRLIETEKATEIASGIFTTGEISGEYRGTDISEQALVIETENGINVITGCAHPGIIEMVERIKQEFPNRRFYSVLGGFHLMSKDKRSMEIMVDRFKEMKIEKAGPTHCSGSVAEETFEKRYGNSFISIKVGQILDI